MSFILSFLTCLVVSVVPNKSTTKPAGISVIFASSTAPCTIHVHALNIPLATGTPLTALYQWDFGDPTGARNALEGFNAGHTYEKEGKYTITLHLTEESGHERNFAINIAVSPDTRRAIYVSAAGSDSFRGQSPQQAIRSLSRLHHLLSGDTKVLLRRGDTFPVADSIVLSQSNTEIGSYGDSKTAPTLQWTGPTSGGTATIVTTKLSRDILIDGIIFDTAQPANDHVATGVAASGTNICIRNCTFLNVDYAINANGAPHGLLVQNCSCPTDDGLREYFLWLQGTDAVVLDNRVANSVFQHDIRAREYDRVLIACNHLVNLDRRNVEPLDFSKSCITMQPGSHLCIADNYVSKGPITIGPLGGDDGLSEPAVRTTWAVADHNQLDDTQLELHHGAEHVVLRNNQISRDDNVSINIDGRDDRYNGRQVVDATIINNSATNHGTTGFFIRLWGKADGLTLVGNKYDAPNLVVGKDDSRPLWSRNNDLSSFRKIEGNSFAAK